MIASFFSYRGRINRATFWKSTLIAAILFMILSTTVAWLYDASSVDSYNLKAAFGSVIFIGMLILWSFPCVKRLHDLGKPGWMYLLMFIPFVNIYMLYLLGFEVGANK